MQIDKDVLCTRGQSNQPDVSNRNRSVFIRKGLEKIGTLWLPFCLHGLMGTLKSQLSNSPRSVFCLAGMVQTIGQRSPRFAIAVQGGKLHILLSLQVGGAGLAVMDDPKRGIQFGAEGLSIPLTAGGSQAKAAKCRLGTYYAKNSTLSEGGRSLFAKGESLKGTELVSLKVDPRSSCSLSCSQSLFNHFPAC